MSKNLFTIENGLALSFAIPLSLVLTVLVEFKKLVINLKARKAQNSYKTA
ncbi:UNVERIFIED_CONTAM: hypothetical protein O8I53_08535 [Campylobacter lari]